MTETTIISVKRLVPADWNPRILTAERFANLKESIKARPEYVEEREILARLLPNGDGEVYAGNQRLRALCALYEDGWMSPWGAGNVPVKLTDISEQEAKARALIDNREWGEQDEQKTAELLVELGNAMVPLNVLGYDDNALRVLLDSVGALGEGPEDPGAQMDRAEELREKWQTEHGQLWTIGKHRLLCGDSTSSDDVTRLMGGGKAQLVFTDPPYGVGCDGGTVERDKLQGDENTALYEPACRMAYSASDAQAPLYIWHAGIAAAAAGIAAAAAGYDIRCEIVWNKNQAQFGALSAQYHQKHEPAYYCVKKSKPARWFGPTNEVTVWDCNRASVNEWHPTQKPPDLAARAMANSSEPGDSVLDLFLGSGSTMVAAEQLGRTCYGMEIESKYVAVALQRMSDMGLTPRLSE